MENRALLLLILTCCLRNMGGDVAPSRRKPRLANIVLFLTDDQDVELGSLNYMNKTLKLVRDHGVEFRHAYVTTPMCCPSRSSLLTGMYIHNHQVFTNKDNCSSPRWQATHETKSFATYLSNAGYRTGYFGKYLNKYNGTYVPPGWREWGGLIMNSKYYNYSLNMNGQTRRHGFEYEKDYYTDVIARDSINFIRHSKKQYPNKPIMLVLAFPAPHGPEDSAPQYAQRYFNVTTHHTPAYNFAPNPDKQWILQVTGSMEPVHKDFTDLLMTKRLQTLQSVDDAVEAVLKELEDLDELDNSYVVYTSDHGYHLGQFGLIKGKSFPFEFDVRVPFLVRGPGIEAGATLNEIVLNIDLAPTFLDLAGVRVPPQMDGRSILPLLFNRRRTKWPDTFLIESSGRRETPHLESKKHEGHLLQYSVPQNVSDLDNDLLVQVFKKLIMKEAKTKTGDYLNTNLITRKGEAPSRTRRDTYNCLVDAQLPCKNRQRWFCKQEGGKWRKYKCRGDEKVLLNDEPKQCICFTTKGTIIKRYLKRNQRKDEDMYCFCDEEGPHSWSLDQEQEELSRTRLRKQKKKEEVCHHERMACFEHNNDHWRTEPKWNGGQFCFCMNANNNTYSCLRTINTSHNFLYCEFTTGFITFYNLRIDPFEMQNRYEHLNRTERSFLHGVLQQMVTCRGSGCVRHLNTALRLNGFPQPHS